MAPSEVNSVHFQSRNRLYRLIMIVLIVMTGICWDDDVNQAQEPSPLWSKPVDITQPSNTNRAAFGVLLCDQYQNVHLLWADLSENGSAIFYRNDVNDDWSAPIDVLAFPGPVAAHLAAAIDNRKDVLHAVWADNYAGGSLWHSQAPLSTANDPRSWSTPDVLVNSTTMGSITTDSFGIIHLVYDAFEGEGTRPTLLYLRSEDGGITWSDPVEVFSKTVLLPSTAGGSIAVDDTGRIHVGVTVRSNDYGVYSEVGYVRSLDGGQTWSEYTQVETMGTTFQGVAKIAPYTFGANEVHLTWHDPKRMHQWSSDGGETWSAPIEIMSLGAAFGGLNQLVKDSAGALYVVTGEGAGIYVAKWDNLRWALPEKVDDRFIDPHGQNIVVCQGNQLHVVYYDRTGENRVWYATRQVNAPHLKRQPLLKPTMQSPAVATPAKVLSPLSPTTPAIATTTPDILQVGPTTPLPASPLFSLLTAAVPSTVLVISIIVISLMRKRA